MVGAQNEKVPKETEGKVKGGICASSDMAQQAPKRATGGQGIAVTSDTGAGRGGKPITIPLSDVSPELKAILIQGMIKGGRAKVVKGKVKGKGKVK